MYAIPFFTGKGKALRRSDHPWCTICRRPVGHFTIERVTESYNVFGRRKFCLTGAINVTINCHGQTYRGPLNDLE